MNKISSGIWLLLVILFASVVVAYTFAGFVTHPGQEMPELGADGGKNIFTYLYQVMYGRGIWFAGMNYPYGEHIVYTDGQPLLSVPLSYLHNRLSMGQALAIMWWFIALSFVLSIVYCYKILRHFQVLPLFAICFATLITLCSPQMLRISGHYALSWSCILPMLFYWTLRYHATRRYVFLLWIFIMGCLVTFLHPYYAAVSLVWVGCYGVGYFVTVRESVIKKARHVLPLLLSVLLFFVVFGIAIKITDPVTDRPVTPFGIMENRAMLKDVVTSVHSPIWNFVIRQFRPIESVGVREGNAYVGLVVIMTLLFSGIFWLRKMAVSKGNQVEENTFPRVWLFMAFASLLFSMGVPFIWHMEWLLNYVSVLKQFRTIGRFSWIFYYIITIYGAVAIYHWYAESVAKGRRFAGYLLLLGALGLWSFEASGYIARTHNVAETGRKNRDVFVAKGQQHWWQFLEQHKYRKEDFQATLVLPFFEVGSEKLWKCSDENISAWGVALGIQAGIQLQLPMVDAMMSRTSWEVAFKQVRLVGGPYTNKPILRDIKTDKPFLMIVLDGVELDPDQQYLLQASDSIGHFQNAQIYAFYPARLRELDKKATLAIPHNLPVCDTCLSGAARSWFVEHFDKEMSSKAAFAGRSGLPWCETVNSVLKEGSVKSSFDNQLYELSCWFLVPSHDYRNPTLFMEIMDSSRKVIFVTRAFGKESADNNYMHEEGVYVTRALWLRANVYFRLPERARFVRFSVEHPEERTFEALDELMLRPADALIITKQANGSLLVNNHNPVVYLGN